MTEQDRTGKNNEQNELTRGANSSNLEREGDIVMPDGTNGPEQPPREESQEGAPGEDAKPNNREELERLANDPATPIDVKRAILESLGGAGEGGIKPPSAESASTPEEQAEQIIESAEDFYEALNKLIKTADYDTAKGIIDADGKGLVSFLTEGLPRKLAEKHLDELKQLKDLSAGETREIFSDTIRNIGNERREMGLEEPRVREAQEEHERLLPEELKETLVESGSFEESPPAEGEGGGDGGENKPPTTEVSSTPEEPEKAESESKSLPEDEKSLQGVVNEIGSYIQNLSKNPDIIHNLTHNAYIGSLIVEAYGSKDTKTKNDEWEEIVDGFDSSSQEKILQSQAKLKKFFDTTVRVINEKANDYAKEGLSHRITSVQELSKWIIKNQDSELWGVDGIYPLLDKDGNFNQANFMIWLREESVKHHKNNPNSEMTPLSSVGISTDYRDISVYAMSLLKEQYMKDTNNHGKVLKDLAGELIYEGFMFGELRNMDLFYIQGMGEDKKIAELLQQIHAKNTLTRPGNLKMTMTMSEDFDEDKNKRDTRVGDAFRIATDIYNNISDPETLTEILGDKPITQEDFKDAIRILKELNDWDEDIGDYGEFHFVKDDPRGFYYADSLNSEDIYLFKEDGSVDMDAFSRAMNLYNMPSEESTKLDVIREVVRLKAAQKSGLKRTGMAFSREDKEAKREKLEDQVRELVQSGKTEEEARVELNTKFITERYAHRANLEFAEIMAYSMQRPYGSASAQDLERAGYNAMTKMNVSEYLLKQGGTNRGGAVGIPEQLGLFRDLSPDPITGIRTESGRTIYEIMGDLRKLDNGKQVLNKEEELVTKEELLDELKFKEHAERIYSKNQQGRAVQIFHTLSDAKTLDLDKIVSWSYLEGVKYNVGEFQEQINEGIIKPFRYSIINSNLNYAQRVRRYDPIESERLFKDEKKSVNVYKTVSLAEKNFGKEIYSKLENDFNEQTDEFGKILKEKKEYKDEKGNPDFNKFLGSYDARVRLAKNSSLGVFAAQLRSHRKFGALGQTWGYHRTETFIDALKTIQEYEEYPPDTGRYRPARDENGRLKRYFSNKDIEWLRKNSGAEVWKMLLYDSIKEGGPALGAGLWKGLAIFINALQKAQ